MTSRRHGPGGYDDFAWLYDRHWGENSLTFLPAYGALVLDDLPSGARVLDLACGTGRFVAELVRRGFRVTGLDDSAEMLALARTRASEAEFVLADARSFTLPERQDAVVSIYDSLNHLLSIGELRAVFACVRDVLRPGGRFVFDLFTEDALAETWRDSFVADDHVAVVTSTFEARTRIHRFEAVVLRPLGGHWDRTDIRLVQRLHAEPDVRAALRGAGFGDVRTVQAAELGVRPGRLFYVAIAGAGPVERRATTSTARASARRRTPARR